MKSEPVELPVLPDRIDLLFRVWRRPGGTERSSLEVATELQESGCAVTPDDIILWRSGTTTPSETELRALASAFPGESNAEYLLGGTEAASIHSQLQLVLELIEGGIKDVRLRREHATIQQRELTTLLADLREQRTKA
jgi:hypothetical protein